MGFLLSPLFKYVLGLLAVLCLLVWVAVAFSLERDLKVVFFDVGQGDAVFIQTPQRHTILIDGGPGSAVLEKLGREMPFWDRSLDVVMLSHPHYDHYRGLLDVLETYSVDYVVWTGVRTEPGMFDGWHHLTERIDAQMVIAQEGMRLAFHKIPDCTLPHPDDCFIVLEVLRPSENLEGKSVPHIDNSSIMAQLRMDEVSFLFTGDAFREVEYELVEEYGEDLSSTVLKVGHHGSDTSTSLPFLHAVRPDLAVIQAGRNNRHGHPHMRIVERLERVGSRILRTDLHGDIRMRTDGKGIRLLSGH